MAIRTIEQIAAKRARDRAYYAKNRLRIIARQTAYAAANAEKEAARSAAWRSANKERKAANDAAWRDKNRSRVTANWKAYREAHRELLLSYQFAWRLRNKERTTKQVKAWTEANKERSRLQQKAWREANKEHRKALNNNRRALLQGAEGKHTKSEIKRLAVRQKFRCANPKCQCSIKNGYHVDHIMPLALGGSNWIKNIQLLCAFCNTSKQAQHPIDWARRNGLLL